MKKLAECLNPKGSKLTEKAHDYLFKVSAGAELLAWNIHLLDDYLYKSHALDHDGSIRLQAMAAKIDAISDEVVDLINQIEEEGLEP